MTEKTAPDSSGTPTSSLLIGPTSVPILAHTPLS
jgi:hypothetical protein